MEAEMAMKAQTVDDVPLIIEMTKQMKLCELLEKFFPTHGNKKGINNGEMAIGWLAFILSQCNHCKNAVREWSNKTIDILSSLLGKTLRDVDFSDDRLASLLDCLSNDSAWHQFEDFFSKNMIEIYELPVETIRLDGSAAYGYHEVVENGIMQYGLSKDHRPDLPQIKMMVATLDPGIIMGLDVFSGEKNDDPLYVPLLQRVRPMINKKGALFIGDCKMSAIGTRGDIEKNNDYYLSPLGLSNEKLRSYFNELVEATTEGKQEVELVYKDKAGLNKSELIVCGYELSRKVEWSEEKINWDERIFVYRSLAFAKSEIALFDKRLKKIELELLKLSPAPKKGTKQFYEESKLLHAIDKILNKSEMKNLLTVEYSKEIYNKKERFVVKVIKKENEINQEKRKCGWRLMVTNAPKERLSFSQAILTYRQEWTLERCFKIIKKSHLGISPLYVRKKSRLKGLVRLLSIAVRIIVLMEYIIGKSLKESEETIKGLDIAHPNKLIATPSAYSILRKFCRERIILSQISFEGKIHWIMSVVDKELIKILRHLKIPVEVYSANYYRNRGVM